MSLEEILKEEAELEKEVYGKVVDNPPEPKVLPEEEGATTKSEPKALPEEVIVETTPTDSEVYQDVTEGTEAEKKTRASWKARFSSYKAATDKTISNLRKENQLLLSNIKEAREKIDTLSEKVATLLSKDEDMFSGVVTSEDIEMIGPEAIDVVKKTTKKATENAVSPLIKEIERLKEKERRRDQNILDEKIKADYGSFLKELGVLVPDYATIDKDPKFKSFLEEYDPQTGEKRVDIFRRSEDYLDAPRIAEFFLDFKDSLPKSKRSILEENITPEGSHSGRNQVTTNLEKESFSQAEVDKFFSDYSKGLYKNKEKEANLIEARITKAYMSGNIH